MNISQLEQKLSQRPLSPLFARLAHEYISADRMDDALDLLLRGIEQHTEYSTAYFALAECYLHGQNLKEALDAIDHAIHMNPAIETLQRVRKEIKTLYGGSAADNGASPAIGETVLPETEQVVTERESEVMTSVEPEPLEAERADAGQGVTEPEHEVTTLAEPEPAGPNGADTGVMTPTSDSTEIEAGKSGENIAAESPVTGYPTTEPQEITAQDEIPRSQGADETDETLIAERLTDLIQSAEINNIPPAQDGEILNLGQEMVAEEENKITSETATALNETTAEPEKLAETTGEVSATDEAPVESAAGEVIQTDEFQNPEEQKHSDESREIAESPPELLQDDYRIVSKTLAEIYVSQCEYGEALMIYRLLKHQKPELGEQIDRRIDDLEKLLRNSPPDPPQT